MDVWGQEWMVRHNNPPIIKLHDSDPKFHHCQWLYGEVRDRKFCQNFVEHGEVWCRYHHEKVYQRPHLLTTNMKNLLTML
jgi:hypothetical protein